MRDLTIVGKGPSLDRLTPDHLWGPGAIVTLNHAILRVREVLRMGKLVGRVYCMQKDGCEPHTGIDYPGNHQAPHDCRPGDMIQPRGDETLIVSEHESANCYASWHSRIIIRPDPWYVPSLVAAVQWAIGEGVEFIRFLCFDSYTRNDYRTWEPAGEPVNHPLNQGYLRAAEEAARLCAVSGVAMRWITP